MEALLCHDYPGNIRELENVLEYAVIVCRGAAIEFKHLPADVVKYTMYEPPAPRKTLSAAPKAPKTDRRESDGKERVLTALRKCNWNRNNRR